MYTDNPLILMVLSIRHLEFINRQFIMLMSLINCFKTSKITVLSKLFNNGF